MPEFPRIPEKPSESVSLLYNHLPCSDDGTPLASLSRIMALTPKPKGRASFSSVCIVHQGGELTGEVRSQSYCSEQAWETLVPNLAQCFTRGVPARVHNPALSVSCSLCGRGRSMIGRLGAQRLW